MNLLILGGTVFLGRHLVEATLARGHQITLFNRGQSNPALYPQLETLHGDRDGDLTALSGRRWDAVIDTCGYVPRLVRASAQALAEAVDHYIFISSISVYPTAGASVGPSEDSPVETMTDETVEEITGETYGPLKALCEQAAEAAMPGRVLTIRPGLIVGPYDPSDRFSYWPARLARGGQVLVPDAPHGLTQFIDVRDLAEWTLKLIEQQQSGIYNATGPAEPLSLGQFFEQCRAEVGPAAELVWVGESFLLDQAVGPFVELPLWLPEEMQAMMKADIGRALAAGLTFRPLAETVADTLAWANTRPADYQWRGGLAAEREQALLKAWREARPSRF